MATSGLRSNTPLPVPGGLGASHPKARSRSLRCRTTRDTLPQVQTAASGSPAWMAGLGAYLPVGLLNGFPYQGVNRQRRLPPGRTTTCGLRKAPALRLGVLLLLA